MSSALDEKPSRSASPSLHTPEPAPPDAVKPSRVLRKLDWRILPISGLFFLLSFLDRTNIGNAKVAGIVVDLHLTGLQYNLCAAVFFITFCFFEIPSNLALKAVGPARWLPTIMFSWGIVMLSMAFVKSFAGLITARVFLGVAEAGLSPGIAFYICLWYPRAAQAQRIALFLSASSFAGAFGGLLAYAIEKLDGVGNLAGWSWIFLLEGLFTVVVAIIAYFLMCDYPENATFLTEAEHTWLLDRLKADNTGLSKKLELKYLRQALTDRHSYYMVGLYFFIIIPAYSFALFLPTIISGLGYSEANAQLLSVPPNVGSGITTVLFGILSDRLRARGPFVLTGSILAIIGYAILYATSSPGAGYAGTLVAALGLYASIACILAWAGGNVGGETKRAVVLAMTVGFGNLGGIASSFIYRAQDSPRYHPGHATNIACLCVVAILCCVAMVDFSRLNRLKEAKCTREGIKAEDGDAFAEMGDASPLYKYTM